MLATKKISVRGSKSTEGYFVSATMDDSIPFKGLISFDWLHIADFSEDITFIQAWPFDLEYIHHGKKRFYTPDYHIVENHQNILIRCLYASQIEKSKNQLEANVLMGWCSENNWLYVDVTEQIRQGYLLQNVKLIRQYAFYSIEQEAKNTIKNLIHEKRTTTLNEIISFIGENLSPEITTTVMNMLFYHELSTPLHESPITRNSPLFINKSN